MSSITAGICPGFTLRLTLSPSIRLLSLAHHTLSVFTHRQTQKKHRSTELWINLVTLWWYICQIYTKSFFKRMSLLMPSRVHILPLDIYGEAYDGPKHWCLTAADTESRLCGHRHRQHLRAWNGAEGKFHIWTQLWGPTEHLFCKATIHYFKTRHQPKLNLDYRTSLMFIYIGAIIFKDALQRFQARSSVYSLVVPFSLWKQFYDAICGSGGSFQNSEKNTYWAWNVYLKAYPINWGRRVWKKWEFRRQGESNELMHHWVTLWEM